MAGEPLRFTTRISTVGVIVIGCAAPRPAEVLDAPPAAVAPTAANPALEGSEGAAPTPPVAAAPEPVPPAVDAGRSNVVLARSEAECAALVARTDREFAAAYSDASLACASDAECTGVVTTCRYACHGSPIARAAEAAYLRRTASTRASCERVLIDLCAAALGPVPRCARGHVGCVKARCAFVQDP